MINNVEKKADNIEIKSRIKYDNIDSLIDMQKNSLKKLDSLSECMIAANKSIDRCLSLLSKSMKGPAINKFIADLDEENHHSIAKTNSNIEEQKIGIMNEIVKLYEKKEEISSDARKEANENEEKEETVLENKKQEPINNINNF